MSRVALSAVPTSKVKVDLLLCKVISGKNRTFHLGGYGPGHIVFVETRRTPWTASGYMTSDTARSIQTLLPLPLPEPANLGWGRVVLWPLTIRQKLPAPAAV
ncbi:unnamed protein product [Prorocentrum cordatum]|uniref:Uncharacterized protein n=1 Tax=Prorocentrum cordatum TaxID=2364126 RepID=A0ABN9PG35_9DINO|nr:unnamed protein product [Polarella glacialis]